MPSSAQLNDFTQALLIERGETLKALDDLLAALKKPRHRPAAKRIAAGLRLMLKDCCA